MISDAMRAEPKVAIPIFLLVLSMVAASAPAREPGEHPRLVSAKTAQCENCHSDLLAGHASVHPPASDDCTTCHEAETSRETGTSISLVEDEPALCLMCHDDLQAAADLELAASHGALADGCTTCHDPHAADHERMLRKGVPSLCQECHDLGDLAARHGGQLTSGTRCAACHAPHGSPFEAMLTGDHLHAPFEDGSCDSCHKEPFGKSVRLRVRGERLCEACHGEMVEEGAQSVHAALVGESRGDIGCIRCHDPHVSPFSRMLKKDGPQLCASCHPAVVEGATGPFGHEAAEDCLNCHQPHGAPEARLLSEPRGELCAACHDLDDTDLASRHLGAPLSELDCLGCHTPHGEGHPSLLARVVHEALEGGCTTCHTGGFDELEEGGESALCTQCHSEIQEEYEAAPRPHAALEMAACVACHNPHASPQNKLVKAADGGPCFECHSEIAPAEGEVLHGIVERIGCEACHEPHGGERAQLLKAEKGELCLGCHREGPSAELFAAGSLGLPATAVPESRILLTENETRDHPVIGHRTQGASPSAEGSDAEVQTSFEGELGCLSCHDPHKGASRLLLRWNAASAAQACAHCHDK